MLYGAGTANQLNRRGHRQVRPVNEFFRATLVELRHPSRRGCARDCLVKLTDHILKVRVAREQAIYYNQRLNSLPAGT